MVSLKRNIGDYGEDISCSYIKSKGFMIIARNYERKWGEIDIIAMARDKTLVFFEVKTLSNSGQNSVLMPEDNLSKVKLKKVRRSCVLFVGKHPELIEDKKGWSIDLLAIILNVGGSDSSPVIRHYENI